MSHVTSIELEVNDLNALDEACSELGVKLVRNQKQFKWFGARKQACDHAITLPGSSNAYEIGVVKDGEKNYKLNWDQWGGAGGLVEKVGADAMKLRDHYGAALAKKQLKRQGYRIRQTVGSDGRVILVAV